jgi:hypothetical protein
MCKYMLVDIWVNEDTYDRIVRLKKFFEDKQERRFENKEYVLGNPQRYRGRFHRKRIKREKINNSFVFNEAFNYYWNDKEMEIHDFEKNR